MIQLPPADKFVKDQILTNFDVYQSRWHVLRHVLLVIGNGFELSNDGEILHLDSRMDLPDADMNCLVDRVRKFYDYPEDKALQDYTVDFQLAIKMVYIKHIDTIASNIDSNDMLEQFTKQPKYDDLMYFMSSSNNTLLDSIYEHIIQNGKLNMDDSWKTVIKDVIMVSKKLIFSHGAKTYADEFDITSVNSWTNHLDFHKYHYLNDILNLVA